MRGTVQLYGCTADNCFNAVLTALASMRQLPPIMYIRQNSLSSPRTHSYTHTHTHFPSFTAYWDGLCLYPCTPCRQQRQTGQHSPLSFRFHWRVAELSHQTSGWSRCRHSGTGDLGLLHGGRGQRQTDRQTEWALMSAS